MMNDPPDPAFSNRTMLGLFEEALHSRELPPPPLPPDEWANDDFPYQIQAFAGRGSSAFVWKATEKQGGGAVALKLIPFRSDGERLRYRWFIEVSALEKLAHPNLARLVDHAIAPDASYGWLALEWIEGACLARLLREQERIPWRAALELCLQACDGLAAIHAAGLVHRDIKPGNLLLEKDSGRLVVADLGISHDLRENPDARLTRTLERAATPAYAPPEQFSPDYSPRPASDQYSLAVTLWEILTGSRPVGAFPRLHSIVKTPPALDRIIRRALDPDPDKRYPSIEAFAKALRDSSRWHAAWWKPLLVLLLAAIPCILAAKHFLNPPTVPVVREITFPMRIQSGDLRVASGRNAYMSIDFTLRKDGNCTGNIRTRSDENVFGFTGVMIIVFRDRDGHILARLQSNSLGVNGRWIPGHVPDRTDPWVDQIPPEIASRVAKVECQAALANHTGYGRLKDTLNQINSAIKGGDYIDPLQANPPAAPPNPIPPP